MKKQNQTQTSTFQRQDKYLVVKRADAMASLDDTELDQWDKLLKKVRDYRVKTGRPLSNRYVVVNEDESYAEIVWKLIELSQTNPNMLALLVQSLNMGVKVAEQLTSAEKQTIMGAVQQTKAKHGFLREDTR